MKIATHIDALQIRDGVVFGGGPVLSYRWFALGLVFGRYVWREKVLHP